MNKGQLRRADRRAVQTSAYNDWRTGNCRRTIDRSQKIRLLLIPRPSFYLFLLLSHQSSPARLKKMKAPRLACLALLLAAAAVSAAPVNLHAPQVAATAADAVAQDEDRRLNSHNVRRKLKKRALDEFDLLDTLGKKRAMKVLDRMALLDSDSDKLHFEPRSGNIFIEDSFDLPAFNATLEAEQQQQRQRRAISDAKPQRYLSNGERFKLGRKKKGGVAITPGGAKSRGEGRREGRVGRGPGPSSS